MNSKNKKNESKIYLFTTSDVFYAVKYFVVSDRVSPIL